MHKPSVALGTRMKEYEATTEQYLDPALPFVVRLDGHGFSKFTRGLQKPFDMRFTEAMVLTARDMLREYRPQTVYTQSDEITLVFFPVVREDGTTQQIPWNGRVQKMSTLMAGFASIRFTRYIRQAALGEQETLLIDDMPIRGYPDVEQPLSPTALGRLMAGEASYFDCRLFNVPSEVEAYNAVYWRHHYDCLRNAVSKAARSMFSAKQMHGRSKHELIAMMSEEAGFDVWARVHPAVLRGVFLKLERYAREEDGIERTRPVAFITVMSEGKPAEHLAMLKAKFRG